MPVKSKAVPISCFHKTNRNFMKKYWDLVKIFSILMKKYPSFVEPNPSFLERCSIFVSKFPD